MNKLSKNQRKELFLWLKKELHHDIDCTYPINIDQRIIRWLNSKLLLRTSILDIKNPMDIIVTFVPTYKGDSTDEYNYSAKMSLIDKELYAIAKLDASMETRISNQKRHAELIDEKIRIKAIELSNIFKDTKATRDTRIHQDGWFVKVNPSTEIFFSKRDNVEEKLRRIFSRFTKVNLKVDKADELLSEIQVKMPVFHLKKK